MNGGNKGLDIQPVMLVGALGNFSSGCEGRHKEKCLVEVEVDLLMVVVRWGTGKMGGG